ncbi:helix-turn-helix domain-containing protein [Psychroserpens mesophilus]|uniref:helix-turn-helix domain-containing protein n=1 Tax=Psychroserpens mesophilus TaxID=325473 RepID=UPI0006943FFC|nr:helix-turn-helix domain-containing protein [Psychroserpens mesophilus]
MKNQNSNSITFDNLPSAVAKVSNEVSIIRNQLEELKNSFEPKTPDENLTRDEVAKILKCDVSTVHNWTVKGKLKKYGIGNKVYYKRAEVEAAIIAI